MEVYIERREKAGWWPSPVEELWQIMPTGGGVELAKKLPHLGLSEVLFIAAVVNLPREERPWGIITWLSEVFRLSRVSVYRLGERVVERLSKPEEPPQPELPRGDQGAGGELIEVTPERIKRTILTGAFPGSVSIRDMQALLQTAFGQSRSIGSISQLLVSAGQRAGEILAEVDWGQLGPVVVLRDETFFQGWPILMLVDPLSSAILLGVVSEDRQAETWATALLMAQDQGLRMAGLVEDMARLYDKSLKLAELALPVQKDPWHVLRLGRKVQRALERQAYAAIGQEEKLTQQLLQEWSDELFEQRYIPTDTNMAQRLAHLSAFEQAFAHLGDALEMVDWRSGEIRTPEINAWLLDETITALAQIDQPAVKRLVKTLRRHRPHLLTYLDWLAASLSPYQVKLSQLMPDPAEQHTFLRAAARTWRLQQALINGQRSFKKAAHQAQAQLEALITDHPERQLLVQHLYHLLDAAGHTSSLIEALNGLLKDFLTDRRSFATLETAQAYLNLFVLWHNMRVFQRGKRQGLSPFQRAGIVLESDDWLDLLGFPAP